jgi:hypothetical protein
VRRRDFIKAIVVSTTWPIAARAQQAGGVKHLGVLMAPKKMIRKEKLNCLDLRRRLLRWVGSKVAICDWMFVGAVATRIGHGFLPKS